ncbi:MAG TPA: gamma-glutamyltransferase [Acidimicrobiia bacterium]|nr:gamma-glutamyltransferase [Acidimicrobiia bacterium]
MTSNAVVTPHRLSAEAGRTILQSGGNAVDAAVAAVAAQGVVAPETCGIGGDLFALVHAPGWQLPRALNASGRAGSNADAESLRRAGAETIPRDHPAAVTVPGCVDGMATLISELGSLDLAEVLAPATELAERGFEVSTEQASAFGRQAGIYRQNAAVADFYPAGRPVERGETVTRLDLARTLREIASDGRTAFYQGQAGADIVSALGGTVTPEDLERGQADWIDPIGVEVGGLTAWTIPPNSQGYLGPAALGVFEMLQPPSDPESPEWWHLLIEAFRCVAWERDDLVSDPDTMALPANLLLDTERLARAASTVDPLRSGVWPRAMGSVSSTAYMCVVDASGLAVSIIQSNFNGTGSPHGAARSGFLLHDRGLGFTLMPGHPNELAPGKRPLHTLSPTLWADDDQPRWTLGTRGGSVQPQLVAQLAARAILGGADLDSAQAAPRWTVSEFGPGSSSAPSFEPGVDVSVLTDLRSRGHVLTVLDQPQPGWGPMSLIELDGSTRRAAADPRVDTTAALLF